MIHPHESGSPILAIFLPLAVAVGEPSIITPSNFGEFGATHETVVPSPTNAAGTPYIRTSGLPGPPSVLGGYGPCPDV